LAAGLEQRHASRCRSYSTYRVSLSCKVSLVQHVKVSLVEHKPRRRKSTRVRASMIYYTIGTAPTTTCTPLLRHWADQDRLRRPARAARGAVLNVRRRRKRVAPRRTRRRDSLAVTTLRSRSLSEARAASISIGHDSQRSELGPAAQRRAGRRPATAGQPWTIPSQHRTCVCTWCTCVQRRGGVLCRKSERSSGVEPARASAASRCAGCGVRPRCGCDSARRAARRRAMHACLCWRRWRGR
jgi:hypothetical protein